MEKYEINWTERAKRDLKKLYLFNIEVIGEEKSFDLVLHLLERVELLKDTKFVEIGAIDEEFQHLKHQYKKLIEGYVKITYRISKTEPFVYINRIFDTRQDPRKNK